MPAQSGLGALGILELDDSGALYGLFGDAEQTGGHLGDHVVSMRDEPLGIASLTGAGERIEALGGTCSADHHRQGSGAKGHAPAVAWHRDGNPGSSVTTLVQVNAGVDGSVIQAQMVTGVRSPETELVEAAAGAAKTVLQVNVREFAGLRHVPVADEHLGGPAIVSQRLHDWIQGQAQCLLWAPVDTEKVVVPAGKADTPVLSGTQGLGVVAVSQVNAVGT